MVGQSIKNADKKSRTCLMSKEVFTDIGNQELILKRRKQLVEAATVLFGRTSYNNTKMKEISKKAGFSSGLIYSYVQSKEDVLFLVLQNIIESYRCEIPKSIENITDPIERFCTAVRKYCEVVSRNVEGTLLAYRSTKDLSSSRKAEIKEMELETNSLLSECVEDCIEAGYFRSGHVDLMTYQVVMLAHGWALKNWFLKPIVNFDNYTQEIVDLFLHGFMTESGWKQFRKNKGMNVEK
jgi:AcrR family transcriptional regulator